MIGDFFEGDAANMSIEELSDALNAELERNSAVPPVDYSLVPIRHGQLKKMAVSPAHARSSVLLGGEWRDSLSMRIGRGGHALTFADRPVIVFPGKTRNGKVWDAFKVEHSDKEILSASEYTKANRIRDSIHANKLAVQVLFAPGTVHEQTINWTWNGRACRSTPDAHSRSHLVDLKTTKSSDPRRFMFDAQRAHYHGQLAYYRQALEQHYGFPPKDAYIVAVENTEPYVTTVFEMTAQSMDVGRRLNQQWFERWIACEQDGHWPGYSESLVPFEVWEPEAEVFGVDEEDEDETSGEEAA